MPEPITKEEWIECLTLPEYIMKIPSGQIRPIAGPIIWIDGNGSKLTTDEYVMKWGADPAPIWEAIKEYRAKTGGGVHY